MALEKLKKTLNVERKTTTVNSGKRAITWGSIGTIRGIMTDAKPVERVRWQQMQHPVTHQIAAEGAPFAKPTDRFVLGDRHFYVQGVENPGELNLWTIYQCEEREDA